MAEIGTGHRQRLKERFLAGEPAAQGDEALLELLLTYAIPRLDVQPLARRLIAQFGSLRAVLAANRGELAKVHGLGEAAITLLTLADHLVTTLDAAPTQRSGPDPLPTPASAEETTFNTEAPKAHGHTDASGVPAPPPAPAAAPDPLAAPATVDPASMAAPTAPRPRAPRAPRAPQPAADPAPATRWRASGRYSAANMLKPGMVEEIRLALDAYKRLGDLAATRRYLQDTGLPQRSRATRGTIVTVIGERLASWNPPRWVCTDLAAAAHDDNPANLKLLLLLHTARQDTLLYAVVQEVLAPRWRAGLSAISHVEMQRFLDDAAPTHPEIHTWSRATRIKLAGNLLTVPRDYGLLVGGAAKRIVEPVISPFAAAHLARLLTEEGIASERVADHPDWALWLLTPDRVHDVLATLPRKGNAP